MSESLTSPNGGISFGRGGGGDALLEKAPTAISACLYLLKMQSLPAHMAYLDPTSPLSTSFGLKNRGYLIIPQKKVKIYATRWRRPLNNWGMIGGMTFIWLYVRERTTALKVSIFSLMPPRVDTSIIVNLSTIHLSKELICNCRVAHSCDIAAM